MRTLSTLVATAALAVGAVLAAPGVALANDDDEGSYSWTDNSHHSYARDNHSVRDDHSQRDDHANNTRYRYCSAGFIGVLSCDDVPILSDILSNHDDSDRS